MARTVKTIEAPRLNDLTVAGVTTTGLITQVNAYLAALVGPVVVGWSLDIKVPVKRMDLQWFFTIVTDDGGPVLANPFTLSVAQATSAYNLQLALQAIYTAILPTQYISAPQITKLDSDTQGLASVYVGASLQNALAVAVSNIGGEATQVIASGLVAAVQNASRFAVGAQGGVGNATEALTNILIPRAGVLQTLLAKSDAAVGGGATVTVTVRKNGVATALTLTFVNADGTGRKSISTPVLVLAGDLITFEVTTDNAGAPAANLQAAVEFV